MSTPEDYQAYEKAHSNCPECGGNTLETTTKGGIMLDPSTYEDTNRADCLTCVWSGVVHDLIPGSIPMPSVDDVEIEITTELDVARPEDDFKGCYVITTAKAQEPYRVWRVIEHLQDYESGDVTVLGEIKDDQWLGEILVDGTSAMAFATGLYHPRLGWGEVFVEINPKKRTLRCERLLLKRRSPGLVWYVEIGDRGLEIKSMKDEEWLDYIRPLQRVEHISFKGRLASWDGLNEH